MYLVIADISWYGFGSHLFSTFDSLYGTSNGQLVHDSLFIARFLLQYLPAVSTLMWWCNMIKQKYILTRLCLIFNQIFDNHFQNWTKLMYSISQLWNLLAYSLLYLLPNLNWQDPRVTNLGLIDSDVLSGSRTTKQFCYKFG